MTTSTSTATPKKTIAIDNSASTGNDSFYWESVRNIVKDTDDNDYEYYFWNSNSTKVSKSQLDNWISTRRGIDGTCLDQFLKYSKTIPENLVIVTDGELSQRDIKESSRLLQQATVQEAKVYIIGSGADTSLVGALSSVDNLTMILESKDASPVEIVKKDLDPLFESVTTIANFLVNYTELSQQTSINSVGVDSDHIANQINSMKSRLEKTYHESKAKDTTDFKDTKDLKDIASLKSFVSEKLTGTKDGPLEEFYSKISHLISLAREKGYRKDVFTSTRITSKSTIVSQELEPVPVESFEKTIKCPIMLDQDCPILLLKTTGTSVLGSLSKKEQDAIINCPVALLKNKLGMASLLEKLDHVVGTDAFSLMTENGTLDMISPMSRAPVYGGISLAQEASHRDFSRYSLAGILTDNTTLPGNIALWYFTVYQAIVTSNHYLTGQTDFMEQFKAYVVDQLFKTESRIGLSGLPGYPIEKVPVCIAVWYVYHSCLYPDQMYRMSQFPHLAQDFIALMTMTGLPIDPEATRLNESWYVKKRLSGRFKYFNAWIYKHEYVESKDAIVYFETLNSNHEIDPNVRAKDPVLFDVLESCECKLGIPQLWGAVNATANDIKVNESEFRNSKPFYLCEWSFYKNYDDTVKTRVCPATLRPWYCPVKDNPEKKVWLDLLYERSTRPGDRFLSIYKDYGEYVIKYSEFPSTKDLLVFCHKRYGVLPSQSEEFMAETVAEYQKVLGDRVSVNEFKAIWLKSMPIDTRQEMEKNVAQ